MNLTHLRHFVASSDRKYNMAKWEEWIAVRPLSWTCPSNLSEWPLEASEACFDFFFDLPRRHSSGRWTAKILLLSYQIINCRWDRVARNWENMLLNLSLLRQHDKYADKNYPAALDTVCFGEQEQVKHHTNCNNGSKCFILNRSFG